MGKCEVCGKKFSMFQGGEFHITDRNIEVCDSCKAKLEGVTNVIIDEPEKAKQLLNDVLEICVSEELKDNFEQYYKECLKKRIVEIEKREEIKRRQMEEQQERQAQLEEQKMMAERRNTLRESIRKMKLTTGYDFQGYRITEYIGLASGEVVLGTGFVSEWSAGVSDFFGTQSNAFADKMVRAKNGAAKKLMESAHLKGGNALIGVDFDYITFSNNILGVSANGTVVVIEKE